jgi:hypothetical protein
MTNLAISLIIIAAGLTLMIISGLALVGKIRLIITIPVTVAFLAIYGTLLFIGLLAGVIWCTLSDGFKIGWYQTTKAKKVVINRDSPWAAAIDGDNPSS